MRHIRCNNRWNRLLLILILALLIVPGCDGDNSDSMQTGPTGVSSIKTTGNVNEWLFDGRFGLLIDGFYPSRIPLVPGYSVGFTLENHKREPATMDLVVVKFTTSDFKEAVQEKFREVMEWAQEQYGEEGEWVQELYGPEAAAEETPYTAEIKYFRQKDGPKGNRIPWTVDGLDSYQGETRGRFRYGRKDRACEFTFYRGNKVIAGPFRVRFTLASSTTTLDLGGGVTLELVQIPAGTVYIGSESSESGRFSDEGPRGRIGSIRPFYLGKFEVTQEQYAAVMGSNPSSFSGRNLPVESVSWYDAVKFCKRLGAKTGREVRLPTEAEWEYACRAGTDTRFYWGDDPDYSQIVDYAWCTPNSNGRTHAVGEKPPNNWGLYDMSGNVGEWCADWYASNYQYAPLVNSRPDLPGGRVYRGGGWFSPGRFCRSANRGWSTPDYRVDDLGFRVALPLPDPPLLDALSKLF